MRITKYEDYTLSNETLTEKYVNATKQIVKQHIEQAVKQIIEVALTDYHLVVTLEEIIVLEFDDVVFIVANPVLNDISGMDLRNAYIETSNGKNELKIMLPALCFAIQDNEIRKINEVNYH